MNSFKRSLFVFLAVLVLPVSSDAQNGTRELRYWGSPEAYLNAQGLVTLELVNAALDSCPPSAEPSLIRKQALYALDGVLHETKFDDSGIVKDFAASRVGRVLDDFSVPMTCDSGVKIYKIYNDGFLIRSKNGIVAVDLDGRQGELIPDSLMSKVVDYCDVLFVTHIHDDHCDENVISLFSSKGKPVYAVGNYTTDDKNVSLIRFDKPKDLKVKFGEGKLSVKVFPGHQDDLLNNVYVFTMPNGVKVAHLGDQYNKEDMSWIRTVKDLVPNLDVLILNCWSNDPPEYIAGFNPKVIVTGHEDELGHTIDHREAFWLTYYKMEEVHRVTVPYVIMGWGECYDYVPR